jgi:nitrous oxidase accessory protein NosD
VPLRSGLALNPDSPFYQRKHSVAWIERIISNGSLVYDCVTGGISLKTGAMVFGVVVSILLCSMPFSTAASSMRVHDSARNVIMRASGYQPHGDIVITHDQDFVDQGWPGNGTAGNPYVISGFAFATSLLAINISNTVSHLLISDCLFTCPGGRHSGMGIQLLKAQNVRMESCMFTLIDCGPMLSYSQKCSISDCRFEDVDIPIGLYISEECTLVRNTVEGCIGLYDSDNCTISSNRQYDDPDMGSDTGFNMMWCDDCILYNNTIVGNVFGIWLSCCLRLTLDSNVMVGNGIFTWDYESRYFDINSSGNKVNGMPLGLFYEQQGLIIDGSEYGQIILASCQNVSVRGGCFDNASAGVIITLCHRTEVTNATSGYNYLGILIDKCDECSVTYCAVNQNEFGIYLGDLSTQVQILNNSVCRNVQAGIVFSYARYCYVLDNVVCDNVGDGISVCCDGHYIYWNTFCRNGRNAIDSGSGNSWDDGSQCGNFWDDMTPGAVYLIPGSAGSVDHYPNGTRGTYTIPPTTTTPPWIGNGTSNASPYPLQPIIVGIAAGAFVIVALASAILVRKRP